MNEKQLLDILTTQYGIAEPSLAFLREGGGHTYIVNGKEKYLLKVIGTAFLDTARQSVSIMRYLKKNDLPVPGIILTKNNQAAFETTSGGEQKLIVLMEFIDGDEPDLKERASEVGALVGRFHQLMDQYPGEPVSHGKEFFVRRYLDFLRKKQYPRLAAYEELGEQLWEKVGNLPQGKCHGDLHRGNLLQRADGQIYLLDFDTACRAPLMFDIMVMCDMTDYFNLKPEDINTTKAVFRKFLSGYAEYHAVSPEEQISFPEWVAIRHFQLQATILEIYGTDCIDERFIDSQLDWLNKWLKATADFGEQNVQKTPAGITESELPEISGLPELLRFDGGKKVETLADWECRRAEILNLYSEYVYGYMPDKEGETLTWSLEPDAETGGTLLNITVTAEGRSASFSVLAGTPLPDAPEGGYPFFIEYWPWHYQNWFTKQWVTGFSDNCRYAMERGYAGIQYDCSQVSQDNSSHIGAFWTLYPYSKTDIRKQRGALLAWAWGVRKVIDALEAGAGEALGINPGLSLVGGVSRYGKSAAVAGAYDERIRVTIPSCSGAGGIAVFRTNNQGKTYDLTSLGGPAQWTNDSQNEPLSNLQGGEGYWFCGSFARIPTVRHLPVDQHMLCALVAGKDRHLIIVTGITSEGWNNTEGQCLAYIASQPVWDLLDCGCQNNMLIHLDGHAVLRSDMETILDYCDVHLRGIAPEEAHSSPARMKGELFLRNNRAVLDPLFDPFLP